MQLRKRYLEHGAVHNFTDLGHRQTAIEYAIEGIKAVHDKNLSWQGHILSVELEGSMRDWVIECLLQGAYIREYHLWEKDCKAYFAAMAARNGTALSLKPKGAEAFTAIVSGALRAFNIEMPGSVFCVIERMRERVNVMKHEAGLELDHFISEGDYSEATHALESFWDRLASSEQITG